MKATVAFDPNKKRLFNDLNLAVYAPQKIRINHAREFKLKIDCLIDKIDGVLDI